MAKKKPNTSLQSSLNLVDLKRGYPTKAPKKGSKKKVHPKGPPAHGRTLGPLGKLMPKPVGKKKVKPKKKSIGRATASAKDQTNVTERLKAEKALGLKRGRGNR